MDKSNHVVRTSASSFECNICFEDPQNPIVASCGHLYCYTCLFTWLSKGQTDCPVCRSKVDHDKIIPVYGRSDIRERPPIPDSVRTGPSIPPGQHIQGTFRFNPFVSVPPALDVTPDISSGTDDRRRALTRFLLIVGVVLIILVVTS